jgi:hypothetical protein
MTSVAKRRLAPVLWSKSHWTLQYASCLNLDCNGWTSGLRRLRPVAPQLALLGDITSASTYLGQKEMRRFLRDSSKQWEKIYWIPGTREYCNFGNSDLPPKDMFKLRDALQEMVGDRLMVLDQTEIEIPEFGIVVLGATGFSTPRTNTHVISPTPLEYTHWWVTDAKGQRRATFSDLADMYTQDIGWLEERISWWKRNRPGTRIVVLTHHHPLPSVYLQGQVGIHNMMRTSLDTMEGAEKLMKDGVVAWLAGKGGGRNVSGCLGKTFFATNDATGSGYMADRRLELEIQLR